MQSMLVSWRVDQLGVVASSVCAVHCALGVVMAGAPGFVGSLVQDEGVEAILLVLAGLFAVSATVMGFRRHRDRWVVALVLVALSLLLIGRFVETSLLPESVFSIAAAVLLIGAHSRNALLLHRVRACCDDDGCAAP